jgi:hypothetical protein
LGHDFLVFSFTNTAKAERESLWCFPEKHVHEALWRRSHRRNSLGSQNLQHT